MRERVLVVMSVSLYGLLVVLSLLILSMHMKRNLPMDELREMSKEEILAYLEYRQMGRSPVPLSFLVIVTLSASGLALGYLLRYSLEKEPDPSKILALLPEPHRSVIKILVEKGGEATQMYIRGRLGIDKVKMSRMVAKMGAEGLIEVVKMGRTNLIRLSGELRDSLNKLGVLKP